MTQQDNCQVLIIGGGPGGYVAAIRAGQLGLNTVLVEANRLGGTCLIRGCIPSKALIHVANRFSILKNHSSDSCYGISLDAEPKLNMYETTHWMNSVVDKLNTGVAALLKHAGVEVIHGRGQLINGKTCEIETDEGLKTIVAEHVILATGSTITELPMLPFDSNVISSSDALQLREKPKHLIVVGAGYIGLELGIAFRKLGSKVTFIEGMSHILPQYDRELSRPVQKWLSENDVEVICSATVNGVSYPNKNPCLAYTDKSGKLHQMESDKVLVAVGRRPATQGWGLENTCIDMDGPFIKVDAQCRTSMKNVWAIGDLAGEPMLAHKASAQGEMVAEIIAGHRRVFDPVAIPSVCFSEPEIISIGLNPEQASAREIETVIGKFPLSATGKALTNDSAKHGGFVRITARKDNHVILGIQAVGVQVSELVNEFSLALEMGSRLEDIAHTIHAHPSIGEATMESALSALGTPIHIDR